MPIYVLSFTLFYHFTLLNGWVPLAISCNTWVLSPRFWNGIKVTSSLSKITCFKNFRCKKYQWHQNNQMKRLFLLTNSFQELLHNYISDCKWNIIYTFWLKSYVYLLNNVDSWLTIECIPIKYFNSLRITQLIF